MERKRHVLSPLNGRNRTHDDLHLNEIINTNSTARNASCGRPSKARSVSTSRDLRYALLYTCVHSTYTHVETYTYEHIIRYPEGKGRETFLSRECSLDLIRIVAISNKLERERERKKRQTKLNESMRVRRHQRRESLHHRDSRFKSYVTNEFRLPLG